MGARIQHKYVFVALLVSVSLPSLALGLNQDQAQKANADLNRSAADYSLRQSTVSAMAAVMNAAALNIPGAIKHGYDSYGSELNAEEFDIIGDINRVRDLALTGRTNMAAAKAIKEFQRTKTTYARLDPAFLYEGKAGQVAAEFERQSGMSREDFLKAMTIATENPIKRGDPMMIDKALTRFEAFIEQVPNPKFKAKLKEAVATVPDTARRGLLAKLIHKARSFAGRNNTPDLQIDVSPEALLAAKSATPTTGTSTLAAEDESARTGDARLYEPAAGPDRSVASTKPKPDYSDQQSILMLAANNEDVSKLFGDTTDDSSLFARIRKQYVDRWPQLTLVSMNSIKGE